MIIRKIDLIFCLILVAVPAAFISKTPSAYAACTLQNPIVSPGQDPSIWYANGLYYLVQSENGGIWLRAAATLGGLATGQHQQIWAPPTGTSYSQEIWGPEIEYLNGQWIIYFAADDGNNNNHRIYAITEDCQKAPLIHDGDEWQKSMKDSSSSKNMLDKQRCR